MRSTIKSAKTVDEAIELGLKDLGLSRSEIEYEVLEDAKSGFLGIFGSKDAIVKISEKEEFKIDINDIYGKKALQEEQLKKEKELAKKRAEEKVQAAKKREAEEKAEQKRLLLEEEKSKAELEEKAQREAEVLDADEEEKTVDKTESFELVKKQLEDILTMMHIEARVEADMYENSFNYNLVDISEEDTGIIIGRKGETLDSLQYILSLMANRSSSEFIRVTLNVANYRTRRKEAIENNARKVAFKVIKTRRSIALDPMNSYERRIVHYALQKYKEVETVSQGSFPNRKVIIKYKN